MGETRKPTGMDFQGFLATVGTRGFYGRFSTRWSHKLDPAPSNSCDIWFTPTSFASCERIGFGVDDVFVSMRNVMFWAAGGGCKAFFLFIPKLGKIPSFFRKYECFNWGGLVKSPRFKADVETTTFQRFPT